MSRYYPKGIPKSSVCPCGPTYVSVLFTEHTFGGPPHVHPQQKQRRTSANPSVHPLLRIKFLTQVFKGIWGLFGLFYGLRYLLSKSGFIRSFVESTFFCLFVKICFYLGYNNTLQYVSNCCLFNLNVGVIYAKWIWFQMHCF